MMNRKPLKMIFYVLLFMAISLIFFGAVSYLTLLLPPVQLKVVKIVGNELSNIITGEIKIGKVKSNLLSYLDLVDVSIKDRDNPEVYVYCSHLKVRYYLPALLKKKLHITSVLSDRLDAHLRVTKKGVYKMPFLLRPDFKFKKNGIGKDWTIKIGTLRVKEINATFNDTLLKIYSSAERASCTAKFPSLDSILVSLDVPNGFFHSDWWYGHVDTVSTQVVIQNKFLYVQHCFAKGSSSTVTGYGRIPFSIKKDLWDLHVVASSNILPVYALKKYVPEFGSQGHAQVKASWTGPFRKPLYSLELTGAGISYAGVGLDTFAVKCGIDKKECIHIKASGSSELGDLNVDGEIKIIDLNSFHPVVDKYSFTTRLEKIRIPALANHVKTIRKIPGDTAALNIYIDGVGYHDVPKIARIDLSIQENRIEELLSLTANLKNHAWNVTGDWGNNKVLGEGTYSKDGMLNGAVTGDLRNPLLISKYFLNESVQGNIAFRALLSGKVTNQVINADIKSSSLKWRGIKVDSLNTSIMVGKQVYIKHGFCSGEVKLDSVSRFFRSSALKGDMKIRADVTGNINHPAMNFAIDGKNINYKMALADSCSGHVTMYALDSIRFNNLILQKSRSQITINGLVNISDYLSAGRGIQADIGVQSKLLANSSFNDAGDLKIRGYFAKDSLDADIVTKEFDVSVLHSWIEKIKNVHGIVTVGSSISGPAQNPTGSVSIAAKRLDYNGIKVKTFGAKCSLQDSILRFDSTCISLDSASNLFISGFVPVSPGRGWKLEKDHSRPGKIYLQSDNLDLSYFSQILKSDWKVQGASLVSLNMTLGRDGWKLGGIATVRKGAFHNNMGTIYGSDIYLNTKIRGNLNSPSVTYNVTTGKVILNTVKIDSTKINGSLENDTLLISSGLVSLFNGGALVVKGSAPFRIADRRFSPSGVDLRFKFSDLACSELNVFTGNELIQGGVISGAGVFGFKQGQPVINGKITLEKGKFNVDGVEPVIGPVNAEFLLNQDTVKIARCKGSWGDGSADIVGFLVWSPDSLKDIALSGKIKNVSIDLPDIATSRIQSFQFAFSKRKSEFLLSGNADVGATRIIRDIRLSDLIDKMNYSIPLEKVENQFLKSVNLKLKVNLVENPILDINLGYMEFTGDLSITGNASNPTFIGDLSIADGYVLYLDRQFNIVDGHVSNYDQYSLNPAININAKTGVNYDSTDGVDTITLSIHGDLKKLAFNLTSDTGGLSEADIISILTFGQRLGSVGGDIKQRIKAFAGQSLLGLGTRKLEQFLDIDRIDVSGDIFDMSSQKSPKISVTKRISPKLMVSYETAIANLSQRKISASFSLTKYFYLRGETENKGESGIDLIFKFSK